MSKINAHGVDRRTVLRSIGGATGATIAGTTLPDVSTAQSNHGLGSVQFVETALEHVGAPEHPQSVAYRRIPYSLDEARGHLGLLSVSPETIRDSDAVAIGRSADAVGLPATLYGDTARSLTASTSFRRFDVRKVPLAEEHALPEVAVETDGEAVEVATDGERVVVAPGNEMSIELSPRTVTVRARDEPSVEVMPRLRVRNHGRVTAFGGPNVDVFPVGANDVVAERTLHALRGNLPEEAVARAGDVVVVERGGDAQ